ncbi:MAG: 30S ribosomal protein S20 [Candidatus Marinimicrobia bacterium]|nr:30S ribosomal protein S20 [Candidatus Neomarinimicrobiota bacterium]MBL7022665.1 30S ribosomal protein S20 [Candidatus Neomarinimicrobiota bacterium]
MSINKSVMKRIRQARKAQASNKHYKSMMKTAIKKTMALTTKENSESILKDTISIIDKVAGKGIIHKNKAARQKSRVTSYINSLS